MASPDPTKKLTALLKKLRSTYGETVADPALEGCPPEGDSLVWSFVFAFMAWEASIARAVVATKRIHQAVVDYNELRVCLNDELVSMIGDRYPRALERATRLRSALNDLYRREHSVSLKRLIDMPKREARQFLDSLDGTPAFISGRMLLLNLGGHAFPLDSRLHQALVTEGAAPPDMDEAAAWLERTFRVGEAAPAYGLLEAWMNDRPSPKAPPRPRRSEKTTSTGARTKKATKS